MKRPTRLHPLLLAACLAGALSMGSKASWGAPAARAAQHETAPGGGTAKPADPDEFDVNKARTTKTAGAWDNLNDHTWSDGFASIWHEFNDFIEFIFGPKRPRRL